MIGFSWNGLPQYAARLIRAAAESLDQPAIVVGSPPTVPIKGMEEALGRKIHWVDAGKPASWSQFGVEPPSIFFQSGWAYPAFNHLGDEVRARGGKAILLSDNNYRGGWRQALGSIGFRVLYRRKFAGWLCPGASGARLARRYGMPADRIWQGMYGADPGVFFNGPPLSARPNRIIYVGQYIERKNCLGLARAFAELAPGFPGWELHLYGSGPLMGSLPSHSAIKVSPFVQPEQLGALYRDAKVFALPSHSEAWGLVVHEAALSGCALLLSDQIGSAEDFAGVDNAATFAHDSEAALRSALASLMSRDAAAFDRAQAESLRRASGFGPAKFAASVRDIVAKLSSCQK